RRARRSRARGARARLAGARERLVELRAELLTVDTGGPEADEPLTLLGTDVLLEAPCDLAHHVLEIVGRRDVDPRDERLQRRVVDPRGLGEQLPLGRLARNDRRSAGGP